MVTVPSFLLRRLYVKGSLRNSDQGVQFQLLNKLGAGYARRLLPLALDGRDVPIERCVFCVDGEQFPFDSVSNATPFILDMNKTTTVMIKGMTVSNEAHKIALAFEVPGMGVLQFDFTDVPSNPESTEGHGWTA